MTAQKETRYRILVFVSILSALAYWSWPLGFILNRPIALHNLASELETYGQPYYQLFINLDILAGSTAAMIGLYLIIARGARWIKLAGAGLLTFGGLVMLAALVPLDCDPSVTNCSPVWHHPTLVIHGFGSIVSVIGLFVTLLVISHQAHIRKTSTAMRTILFTLIFAWTVFGAASLVDLVIDFHTNIVQYYFITICSLSIPASIIAIKLIAKKGFPE